MSQKLTWGTHVLSKSVYDFVTHSPLSSLLEQLESMRILKEEVQKVLPPELREHCMLANYKNNYITISASTAVWATRLKYIAPELLKALKQKPGLSQLEGIVIKTLKLTHEG